MSITISAGIGFSVNSITQAVAQCLKKFGHCCITKNLPLWFHSTGDSLVTGSKGKVCVCVRGF